MARPTSVSIIKCALLLFFLAVFGLTITTRFTATSSAQIGGGSGTPARPAQTPPAQTPPASTEKTAEQVYKNIKVLNGMPASQVMMAMNFMRASLGVNCAFCHVQNGNEWDFAADTKREKGTARKMITMVKGINTDSFNGQTRVSCFTCHRGNEHTNGMPPLPQEAPAGGPGGPGPGPSGPAGPAGQDGPPPVTPDQLFDKFIAAVGGRAALEAVKSRVAKGTQTTTDGRSLTVEIAQSGPNKYLETASMARGAMVRGYDGAKGWSKDPRGVNELAGNALSQLVRQADLAWPVNLKAGFTNVRMAGKDKIGDREVFVVVGTVGDSHRERFFFDAQSGLLLRVVSSDNSLIGWIPSQTDYEDYRDIGGGVKVPFTVKLSLVDPWSSWTRKFTEIKLNAPVDEKSFAMPAAAPAAPPKS